MKSLLTLLPAIPARPPRYTYSPEAERLKRDFVVGILDAMERGGLSQTDVARRMGTSRQHVSKLLDPECPRNISFETMALLAQAIGARADVILTPVSPSVRAEPALLPFDSAPASKREGALG